MELDHEFTVPVPVAEAWPVLLDVERIAPCMPGATVTSVTGDEFAGKVKVKVGPITVTYGGTASFLETDESARRAVIEARGKETRGTGTATAKVTAQLHDEGDATRVTVHTDLAVTGKPAQFGRGVMADVGAKLLGQFADCLAQQLAARPEPAAAATGATAATGDNAATTATATTGTAATGTAGTTAAAASEATAPAGSTGWTGSAERPTDDTIDLLGTAGGPVLKRLAPVLAAVVLLILLVAVLRRRRAD